MWLKLDQVGYAPMRIRLERFMKPKYGKMHKVGRIRFINKPILAICLSMRHMAASCHLGF